jgi:Fur family zinc uptake transcriptional regulator
MDLVTGKGWRPKGSRRVRPLPLPCPHAVQTISTGAAVSDVLRRAQVVSAAAGKAWTAPRRRTYELLAQSGRAMKAYDLLTAFRPGSKPTTAPPTIYRSLGFLVELGLVHRLESLNAFIACRRPARAHVAEFLICDCCGAVEECGLDSRLAAEPAADLKGFQIARVLVEVHGRCATCQPSAFD